MIELIIGVAIWLVTTGIVGRASYQAGKTEGAKELLNHQHKWQAINATYYSYDEWTKVGFICIEPGCDGTKVKTVGGRWKLDEIQSAKEAVKELEWPTL